MRAGGAGWRACGVGNGRREGREKMGGGGAGMWAGWMGGLGCGWLGRLVWQSGAM